MPRLVDVGVSLTAPTDAPLHGAYQLTRLEPGPRVQAWHRDGAHFAMSLMGAIRVWSKQRLVASECIYDRQAHGALEMESEDIAYLEAYLLTQKQAWNSPHTFNAGNAVNA